MGTKPVTAKIRKREPDIELEISEAKLRIAMRKLLKHKPAPMPKRKKK